MNQNEETATPSKQKLWMVKLEALIYGWERLKSLRDEIKDQPNALGLFWASIDAQPGGEASLARQLEVIIPVATAEVSAWLADQFRDSLRSEKDPITAVVMLWDSYRAIGRLAQDKETRGRWLAGETREERNLLTSLSKHHSLPTS